MTSPHSFSAMRIPQTLCCETPFYRTNKLSWLRETTKHLLEPRSYFNFASTSHVLPCCPNRSSSVEAGHAICDDRISLYSWKYGDHFSRAKSRQDHLYSGMFDYWR